MAKLQKEKRSSTPQQPDALHSTSSQPRMKAVRLTPAEIRAQNNGELSKRQSQVVPAQSSTQIPNAHVTPPPSPTKDQSAYQAQVARTASQSHGPPTPPLSPRLSLMRSTCAIKNAFPVAQPLVLHHRQSMPIEASRGIVGTPAQSFSRTSSISGSIKVPMKYRGHEITRTGSLSMFQAPPPDIVMNPLSNFSRPRNKYSPPGSFNRQDGNEQSSQPQHRRNDTADTAITALSSRSESPVVRSDSPVSPQSMGSRASRQFVIVDKDSLPKDEVKKEAVSKTPTERFPTIRPKHGPKASRDMTKAASVFFEKAPDTAAEKEIKKKRRHTFSWKRISRMDLKTEFKSDLEAPKEESVTVEAEKPRPKSAGQPSAMEIIQPAAEKVTAPVVEDKDKGKEIAHDYVPAVAGVKCCEKCGRIKKLREDRALLSDGKTKEALVVAGPSSYKLITAPVDRQGTSAVNPAGAANAAQLIMHRQRRPKPEPPAALSSDHVVKDFATSPARVDAPHPEIPKAVQRTEAEKTPEKPACIVRFASLHGISHEEGNAPPMSAMNTNVDTNVAEEIPQMKATSTPIDEPLPEFIYDPAGDSEEFFTAPTTPRRYSFESQRSVLDVVLPAKPTETPKPGPDVARKAPEPIDSSKPVALPEPNLGQHFARSNLTLRGLVVPKGGSSSNLLGDAMKAAGKTDEVGKGLEQSDQIDKAIQSHELRVSEIMAV